jgi:Rrf2 family iron-sulfur cluster assembly transcriptional regulator
MKLTTKGRYAVTALLDLALNRKPDSAVALVDISVRQNISQSYLEQLFAKLRKAGLVTSIRGPRGGYSLALPASDISVARIIEAIDEPLDTTKCGGASNCQKGERCITHNLWESLNTVIFNFLEGVSLQQLIAEASRPGCEEQPIEFIDNTESEI